jgi:hypothetical protein
VIVLSRFFYWLVGSLEDVGFAGVVVNTVGLLDDPVAGGDVTSLFVDGHDERRPVIGSAYAARIFRRVSAKLFGLNDARLLFELHDFYPSTVGIL